MAQPASTAFEGLSDRELTCLYRALCLYVAAPESGVWFHHAGKNDPAYGLAADEKKTSAKDGVDRPQRNTLFAIGHRVHGEIARRDPGLFKDQFPPSFRYAFASWEAFCRAVSGAADPEHRSDSGPSSSSAQDRLSPRCD